MFPRSTRNIQSRLHRSARERIRDQGHFSLFGRMSVSKNYNTEKALKVHTIDEGSAKYSNPDNTAAAKTPDGAIKGLNAEPQ